MSFNLTPLLDYISLIIGICSSLILILLSYLGILEKVKPHSSPYRNRYKILLEMVDSSTKIEKSFFSNEWNSVRGKYQVIMTIAVYLGIIPFIYLIAYFNPHNPSSNSGTILYNVSLLYFFFAFIPILIDFLIKEKLKRVENRELEENFVKLKAYFVFLWKGLTLFWVILIFDALFSINAYYQSINFPLIQTSYETYLPPLPLWVFYTILIFIYDTYRKKTILNLQSSLFFNKLGNFKINAFIYTNKHSMFSSEPSIIRVVGIGEYLKVIYYKNKIPIQVSVRWKDIISIGFEINSNLSNQKILSI